MNSSCNCCVLLASRKERIVALDEHQLSFQHHPLQANRVGFVQRKKRSFILRVKLLPRMAHLIFL